MRITFVISSLSSGGAERVMSNMANYWANKDWQITLITLAKQDSDFYPLDKRILRIALEVEKQSSGIIQAVTNNFFRLLSLRSAIKSSQPQVVISFIDSVNVLTLVATRFLNIPIIISERTDPQQHFVNRFWDVLRILFYPYADALIVQSKGTLKWATQKLSEKKIFIISNAVFVKKTPFINDTCKFPQPFIVAVGRLGFEKGFDLLLQSFQKIALKYPDWSLVIVGEGKEREVLEEMAIRLGIEQQVSFIGLHKNPMEIMIQASLFVLPSRYEGFPNALLEAMACGLPVISFDCPSGPREIIRHGIDGLLVPAEDVIALTNAMQELIACPEKRLQLSVKAREVTERFSQEKIMEMWEKLLVDCIKEQA